MQQLSLTDWLYLFASNNQQYDTDIKQQRQATTEAQNAYQCWLPV